MVEPSRQAPRADLVVGIPATPDRLAAAEAAMAVQAQLRAAFPANAGAAVVLSDDRQGAVSPDEPLAVPAPGGAPPTVFTGERLGARSALPALLEVAVASGAPACALVEPLPRDGAPEWLHWLLDPVLRGGFDVVCPAYRRRKLENLLNTGLAYPLTRALFGRRLRQPLGREIALSRRLAERILEAPDGGPEGEGGEDLWVITQALSRECRVCESFLGPRPPPRGPVPDVPQALAGLLGTIFHGLELHAPLWQRTRSPSPVETFGDSGMLEDAAGRPDVAPLVSAFALGWQDLRSLWAAVLPPQALLALQRLPRDPPEAFRMGDRLWARLVYDFAVGWRVKAMDRAQLLRSMAPLYLGWAAGWVNEVATLDGAASEARAERLCEAFEAEKPYLISRWRWPDRFLP